MHAGTSASGRNRPPNSPKRPSGVGSAMKSLGVTGRALPANRRDRRGCSRTAAWRRRGRWPRHAQLAGVLAARLGLDTGGDIDTPGMDGGDGVADVLGREAAGQDQAEAVGRALGQLPVEHLTGAGRRRVEQHRVGAVVGGPLDGGIAGRERLDQHGDSVPHPPGLLRRLAAVQLRALEADLVDDLDDARGRLVAEHADGDDLRWQALDDVGHERGRDLAGRRGEHEADGVGVHGHRQQRVLLARGAAHLHEHGRTLPDPPVKAGRRRGRRP